MLCAQPSAVSTSISYHATHEGLLVVVMRMSRTSSTGVSGRKTRVWLSVVTPSNV